MAEKLKIPTQDFSLTSSWTCAFKKNGSVWSWKLSSGPTTATEEKAFSYSLASGVKVSSAKIYTKVGSAATGAAFIKVDGSSKWEKYNGLNGYPIKLNSKSGTARVKFSFKANGKVYPDANTHYSTLSFGNTYLEIVYSAPKGEKKEGQKKKEDGFLPPPQTVCIYDQKDGKVYLFDGVPKIQHSFTMDIQEEPDSKNKDKYINNARNNPDKLTIDIVMSDVYSGAGAIYSSAVDYTSDQKKAGKAVSKLMGTQLLPKSKWTRSEAAANALHWLKEQRRLLSVITPQYIHVDMILSSVTINQDENCPFGWEGQLAFQHAFEKKEVKRTEDKPKTDDKPPDPTMGAQKFGDWSSWGQSIQQLLGLLPK